MILKISFRAKAGVPKTLLKRKLGLDSLYFPQNTLMLTEFCGEFSDLHSIFRLRALRYYRHTIAWHNFLGLALRVVRPFVASGNFVSPILFFLLPLSLAQKGSSIAFAFFLKI